MQNKRPLRNHTPRLSDPFPPKINVDGRELVLVLVLVLVLILVLSLLSIVVVVVVVVVVV